MMVRLGPRDFTPKLSRSLVNGYTRVNGRALSGARSVASTSHIREWLSSIPRVSNCGFISLETRARVGVCFGSVSGLARRLSQNDAQIGHAVTADGTAINLEGAEGADETGVDRLLAVLGK